MSLDPPPWRPAVSVVFDNADWPFFLEMWIFGSYVPHSPDDSLKLSDDFFPVYSVGSSSLPYLHLGDSQGFGFKLFFYSLNWQLQTLLSEEKYAPSI